MLGIRSFPFGMAYFQVLLLMEENPAPPGMVKNPTNNGIIMDNHHPWWLAGFWDPSTVC